jgi:hypothetical protein
VTAFELVAGVIAVFFCCGIVLGVLFVIALGRGGEGDRVHGRGYRRFSRSDTGPGGQESLGRPGREESPGPDDDDDIPPRWPGGTSA